MSWASILIWFVLLISNRVNPALILWFGVLLSWFHSWERVRFVPDSHGGQSDSIVISYVWQSSLRSRVDASHLETLSSWQATGGKYGGIPQDIANEALLLMELLPLPQNKGSVAWCNHRLACLVWVCLASKEVCFEWKWEGSSFDGSLIFVKEFPEHPPRSLDDGMNNKVVPPWSIFW